MVLWEAGGAAPACKQLSPHQHRAENFTLKRDAGEGNQRGGVCSAVYEHIVFFLNIKLFIFYYSGHFQRPLFVVIDAVCEKLAYLYNTQKKQRNSNYGCPFDWGEWNDA